MQSTCFRAAWRNVTLADETWVETSSASFGRDFDTWEFLNKDASSSDAAFSKTFLESLLARILL